jgi:hypothetical protein
MVVRHAPARAIDTDGEAKSLVKRQVLLMGEAFNAERSRDQADRRRSRRSRPRPASGRARRVIAKCDHRRVQRAEQDLHHEAPAV